MHTNTFNNDPFYSNGASARFAETTNDTGEVGTLSVRLGERLWWDGFRYSKCGVMITELSPETVRQPAIWGELHRESWERVWRTIKLNATLGRDTVRILGVGPKDDRTLHHQDGRMLDMSELRQYTQLILDRFLISS
jgi:DNA polymerase V